MIGVGASVAVHAALLVTIASGGADRADGVELSESLQLPKFRLGDEVSDRVTINWIGFEDPARHQARESEIDSPELATLASSGEVSPTLPIPPQAPVGGGDASPKTRGPAPGPAVSPQEGEGDPGAAPRVPLPAAPSNDGAGSPSKDGAPSDRESAAVSREPAYEFRSGEIRTSGGVRVRTVSPKFAPLTRFTALPGLRRHPIVTIKFWSDGTVAEAVFEPKQNTGISGIDGPVLNAAHEWTAEGEAIDDLAEQGEDATHEIRVKFLLG